MGEDQPDNNAGRAVEWVTAREAATLLGVHYNTIRNRIKTGMYRAEKFQTENGPTWMIERDSLIDNAPTSARQQAVSGVPAMQQEAIQELARAIVRESGVARDPEHEARLEGNKIQVEAAKTQILVASGSLVGIAAITSALPTFTRTETLFIALALIFGSLLFAFIHLHLAALETAAQGQASLSYLLLGMLFLVAGLFTFAVYVLFNLPIVSFEGQPVSVQEKRELVVRSIQIAVVGTLIVAVCVAAWRILRRRTERPRSRREAE